MNLRALLPWKRKSVEGQYHEGPWFLPVSGGWLPQEVGKYWNFWQLGYDPVSGGTAAMVEACVSAYAQTIAMCPGSHWLSLDNGGRERITTSALSRIMRRPNDYQSISDYLLNTVRSLYFTGNAYSLALRNDRFEIDSLHLMDPRRSKAMVAETGDVFYDLAGNELIDRRLNEARLNSAKLIVPARDVLHIRLQTPRHTLLGETPLCAAALDVAASGAISQQQLSFYLNQARPSQVLGTDLVLKKEQVDLVRELWNEQTKGVNAGGTPILTAGLKPLPLSMTAEDAQLAEIMKMTDQHIALVFRIPLQILGIGGTPFASTEALMQSWIASGLGFAINHIEEAFARLFGLRGGTEEYLELDTKALLRSATAERIAALVQGVQGGIYSPNEARAEEALPVVEFGDEPRVQQQVVPLSFGQQPPEPPAPPAPQPAPPQGNSINADEQARVWAGDLYRAADEFELDRAA